MNILYVVAHPDDEVLGAGATIHKLINEGHKVAVATLVSSAGARKDLSNTLSEDQAKAFEIMGVSRAYGADFPNIQMNTVPHLQLVQFIEACIEDWKAESIYTHHPSDTNNDHVMTSYAAQAASRLFQRKPDVLPLKQFIYMEVPSSTEWSFDSPANRFSPNMFVEIGKEGLDVKIKALSAYAGVMRPYPHPRSEEAITGLSLAALAGDDNGQAIFPAQLVAHVPYTVIAPFVGIVFVVVYEVHRAENNVVMDMPLVNVRRHNILMLPLCYRVGKLLSDFMGFLIIDFPRLKGLYQMKG